MKKLMIAATVAMCGVMLHAEGLSSSIVGYFNDAKSVRQASLGPVFKRIGTDGSSYKLKDIVAKGMSDAGADCIQFLSEDNAATYLMAVWVDPKAYGEEYGGWWDFNNMFVKSLDEQEFAAGTAFLCLFTSGNTVTFTSAGEVERGRTISTNGKRQPFIANPLPVNLTLGQITAKGMSDAGADCIQFLSTDNAATCLMAVWVDPTAYGAEYGGWWDFNNMFVKQVNDTPVPAGAAFLCLLTSGNNIAFEFPDPLK